MGQIIRGMGVPYELITAHEKTHDRRTLSFLDREEALRFLRLHASAPDDVAALRRFLHDLNPGLSVSQHLLERIALGLAQGSLYLVERDSSLSLGQSGGDPKPVDPDPPGPGPKPKPETTAELLVNVKDADGRRVEGATVSAGSLGTKVTDKSGAADYGKVKPGAYDISAEKPGHSPKRDAAVAKDEKKAVSVPDGKKTVVDLIQHPSCANVAAFEGPTTRTKYFGFDHKSNLPEAGKSEYWVPVPDKGKLTMKPDRLTRDGGRWVSVGVGTTTELEISFLFKGPECVPCIGNSTFKILDPKVAEVVTAKVGAKKAAFTIKGKAAGETSLKVICDGHDLGWFHIWCEKPATLLLDVATLITKRAPAAAYDLKALSDHFNDIYRQIMITVDMQDLGSIDLSGDPGGLDAIEAKGYAPGPQFTQDVDDDVLTEVLRKLDLEATKALATRKPPFKLPRAGAYRLFWYVPAGGADDTLGMVPAIGGRAGFGFEPDSPTARNSSAHEFGHCLGLLHPSDPTSGPQFCAHNRASRNVDVPDHAKTNTEPASVKRGKAGNVMANDPTNLMGYWPDRPNRKPLRYHQWKAAQRS